VADGGGRDVVTLRRRADDLTGARVMAQPEPTAT